MLGGEAVRHEQFSSIVSDIGLPWPRYSPCRGVWRATTVDANLATAHHHEPIYHKNTRVTDAKALELVKQAAVYSSDITAECNRESEQYA